MQDELERLLDADRIDETAALWTTFARRYPEPDLRDRLCRRLAAAAARKGIELKPPLPG